MKCPRDGTELIQQRHEAQIDVNQCPTCQGFWLDKGELETIQERAARYQSRDLDEDVALDASPQLVQPIRCPKCGGEMERREHGYCSRVYIDTCIEGCGVWLDTGELAALEKFYENQHQYEDTDDVVTYLYVSLLSLFRRSKHGSKPAAKG